MLCDSVCSISPCQCRALCRWWSMVEVFWCQVIAGAVINLALGTFCCCSDFRVGFVYLAWWGFFFCRSSPLPQNFACSQNIVATFQGKGQLLRTRQTPGLPTTGTPQSIQHCLSLATKVDFSSAADAFETPLCAINLESSTSQGRIETKVILISKM